MQESKTIYKTNCPREPFRSIPTLLDRVGMIPKYARGSLVFSRPTETTATIQRQASPSRLLLATHQRASGAER